MMAKQHRNAYSVDRLIKGSWSCDCINPSNLVEEGLLDYGVISGVVCVYPWFGTNI